VAKQAEPNEKVFRGNMVWMNQGRFLPLFVDEKNKIYIQVSHFEKPTWN
jgi:hypothetical protein